MVQAVKILFFLLCLRIIKLSVFTPDYIYSRYYWVPITSFSNTTCQSVEIITKYHHYLAQTKTLRPDYSIWTHHTRSPIIEPAWTTTLCSITLNFHPLRLPAETELAPRTRVDKCRTENQDSPFQSNNLRPCASGFFKTREFLIQAFPPIITPDSPLSTLD